MTSPLAAPERPGGPPPRRPAPPVAAEPPRPRLAAAAVAAALLAALALPGERPGLGVLLVALAVAAAAGVARDAPRSPRELGGRGAPPSEDSPREGGGDGAPPSEDSPREGGGDGAPPPDRLAWPRVWGALAIVCASIAVLRDASWVVWPAILGAVALGSVAVAGGATWASLVRGLFAAAVAAPLGLATVARAGAVSVPADASSRAVPILRGAAIAAPLLAVFGVLFASGDRAFAQLAEDSLPSDVTLGLLPLRVFTFVLVAALVGGLVLARRADRGAAHGSRRLRTVEWAIPLGALNLLFGAFVAVQFAVLFGGDERVLETAGLTYAEYAREGYGQLLVAAALTLAVVGGALRWGSGDRRLLRVLLAVLCVLTGVVLASALHRLDLYQDAFGATRLRVTATATLLWLGAILALVLAALATDRHRFLPRTALLVTTLAGLSFALWNPDLRIAERNMERDTIDRAYLRTLSADAAPALPAALRSRPGDDGWGGWNVARSRSRD
jgi:hypothetical protein